MFSGNGLFPQFLGMLTKRPMGARGGPRAVEDGSSALGGGPEMPGNASEMSGSGVVGTPGGAEGTPNDDGLIRHPFDPRVPPLRRPSRPGIDRTFGGSAGSVFGGQRGTL